MLPVVNHVAAVVVVVQAGVGIVVRHRVGRRQGGVDVRDVVVVFEHGGGHRPLRLVRLVGRLILLLLLQIVHIKPFFAVTHRAAVLYHGLAISRPCHGAL